MIRSLPGYHANYTDRNLRQTFFLKIEQFQATPDVYWCACARVINSRGHHTGAVFTHPTTPPTFITGGVMQQIHPSLTISKMFSLPVHPPPPVRAQYVFILPPPDLPTRCAPKWYNSWHITDSKCHVQWNIAPNNPPRTCNFPCWEHWLILIAFSQNWSVIRARTLV